MAIPPAPGDETGGKISKGVLLVILAIVALCGLAGTCLFAGLLLSGNL